MKKPHSQLLLLTDDLPPLENDAAVLAPAQRHSPKEQPAGNVEDLAVKLGQRAAELQIIRSLLFLTYIIQQYVQEPLEKGRRTTPRVQNFKSGGFMTTVHYSPVAPVV